MKILSWNINGYRSTIKKGLFNPILELNPDIICLQEIKLNEEIISIKDYYTYYNFAIKKGYSGVAVLSKIKPIKIETEIGLERFDNEGRFLLLEFDQFILINLYIPQGGRQKENLGYKLQAIEALINKIRKIDNKNIIICTDFNIAHSELDVLRYKGNYNNIMFTKEERAKIDHLLVLGFIDVFRDKSNSSTTFSWWPNAFNCRERNIGWRIDYIFMSRGMYKTKVEMKYLADYYGSDHCPMLLEM
jgi:exodeoxyribonuclease-3